MDNIQIGSVLYGLGMAALGFVAGIVLSYNRVNRFIERIQQQLGDKAQFYIRVSPWYKLRVMLFGVPKK